MSFSSGSGDGAQSEMTFHLPPSLTAMRVVELALWRGCPSPKYQGAQKISLSKPLTLRTAAETLSRVHPRYREDGGRMRWWRGSGPETIAPRSHVDRLGNDGDLRAGHAVHLGGHVGGIRAGNDDAVGAVNVGTLPARLDRQQGASDTALVA